MSCRIITSPITGKEETSQTWNDIRALVATEEEADKLYNQLRSDEFKNWFGDWTRPNRGRVSKVVNSIGEPLVVYHGTDKEFNTFDQAAEKQTIADQGFYFAPTRNQVKGTYGDNIIPAFINANVLISDTRLERISEKKKLELQSQGYDGYVYSYNNKLSSADDIVVFEPNQIKSVFNVGTFGVDKGGYDNTKAGFVEVEGGADAQAKKMAELKEKGAVRVKPVTGGVSFYFDPNNINFQLEGVPASKANKATLDIIKTAAAKMGISIEELDQYTKDAKLDIEPNVVGLSHIQRTGNAVKAVIAIAEGREDQALTEEYVHIARAIVEQTNPQLVTSMIAKIDRFKIYDAVYKEYSKNPKYQLSNGKPDIRKIKMEAVDKLMTELLINQNEGSTEFPELMEEKNRSMLMEWWNTVLDFIRGIYSKTNIDIFKSTADIINSGNIEGTVQDIKQDALFYQLKNNTKVDEAYNRIMSEANKMKGPNPEIVDAAGKVIKARHYIYDNVKEIFNTVSKKVKSKFPDRRSDLQKKLDDMKKDWGSDGHRFIEKFIGKALIDKNGYKLADPLDIEIDTNIEPKLQEKIKGFAIQLVNSYPPGTRFLVEKMVVNTKTKDMLASTIDFIAIAPNEKGDDIKVDIFDWKFSNINKSINDDIPGYKTSEWNAQMNEYEIMLINYGFKRSQLRHTRMVPFITGYVHAISGDTKSPLLLSTLEVGDPTNMNANDIYTLPVPSLNELTDNPEVDRLISALRAQWQKLNALQVDPEKKQTKKAQLAQISIAIRNLQVRLNFAPITAIADTFFKNAGEAIKGFDGINYDNLSAEELNDKLGNLIEYKKSALKFVDIDQVFLSAYPKEGLNSDNKIIREKLEHNAALAKRLLEKIDQLQTNYAISLTLKQGIADNVEEIRTKDGKFKAERAVIGLVKSFFEGTQIPAKLIKLGSKLVLLSKNKVTLAVARKLDEFKPILLALEKEAAGQGKSAFDLIGTIEDTKLNLIKKINPKFYKDYKDAKENKDKQFLLDNVDLVKYKELAEEAIQKQIQEIENTTYDVSDVNNNNNIRDIKIKNVRNSLDITKDKFDGYNDYTFDRLFRKSMLEDKHISEEYKKLAKNEAALNAWKFFIDLNERAYKAGYLEEQGMSFFPLMEATIFKKIEQSKSGLGDAGNFLKDLYTTTEDESTNLSKIDPETGELDRRIPKPFLRSKKPVEALSRDVAKIGTLWVKALYEYENTKGLENTLLTLAAVEENKGSIITDGDKVVFDGSIPRVNYGKNENASIMNAIVDDYLYGKSEDNSSLGNTQLGNVVSKLNKDKEVGEKRVTNVKKAIKNADILTRALAVGWKPLISIANSFGNNFQAYINSGDNYKYAEYLENTGRVVSGAFSKEKKAILHLINPLNEDISTEKLREITKEIGIGRWLSTWSFSDVMMVTNSFPEKRLQYANALSFIDNSMVKGGKIVNIRKELAKEDRATKYKMTFTERRQLESTFEERVTKLKETNSLEKNVKIEGDKISIEGVSDDALAEYRTTVVEYNRDLNGQMSVDNKAAFTRDTIFKSFMMFKTWIPKQVILRGKDIAKNAVTGDWEYGRGRVFLKVWAQLGTRNIMKMRDIITGSEEGLRIMDEILQAKKEEYLKKYGEELVISDEEFYDMMRSELENQIKELKLLVGLMAMFAAAGAAIPDDDDTLDAATKNRYKYLMKGMHKIQDELSFYYNPVSMESITKGSLIPSLGLLSKTYKIFTNTAAEGYGFATGDEQMMKKAYPLKYTFNIVPGVYQAMNEVVPYVFPEVSKELGIRVSSESRTR